MILKIIDEKAIENQQEYHRKRKGDRYSLNGTRKNSYTIRAKVYDQLLKSDPPYTPSRSHYKITFDELKHWSIIIMDQQKEWMTTDLGHICLIYNHDPKHYKTICLFWSHVCFRAHTGILLGIDGRNPANSTNPIVFAEPQEGITPEDILEYKGRISLPHIDTNKMEITLDELKEYFDLLTKHKILQMKGNPGTVRFVLNKDYTQFMLKSHTIFVNLLKERMEFRWASVHRPEPEELEWYKTIFGNKNTKEKTSDLAMQFKSKKAKDSEQKKHCEKELMKYDKEIINDYDYLSKESDKLDAIPGFVDTILTFICHTDLLKLIRSEYDTLTKRLNF